MREVLHDFIIITILPIFIILPLSAIITFWKRKVIPPNFRVQILTATFIVSVVYFFLFLEFKNRIDNSINSLIINEYTSKVTLFDYAEEKNIKYYDYKSSDPNASLKASVISWSSWLIFLLSYSVTIFFSRKRD